MGMTMTQKILAAHAGLDSVVPGQLIEANLDMVLGNDVTSPVAINEMNKFNKKTVFDKTRISLVMDHFTPNKDIQSAENCKQVRRLHYRRRLSHLHIRRSRRIFNRRRLNRYGGRNGNRQGLVQSSVCYQGCYHR